METTQDRFGEEETYLSANDWLIGAEVRVKVLSYIAKEPYETRDGKKKKAWMYVVDDRGIRKDFRLTIKNGRIAKNQFKIKDALQGNINGN